MIKAALWFVTFLGVTPALFIALTVISVQWQLERHLANAFPNGLGENIHRHDSYMKMELGSVQIAIAPRRWAAILVAVGFACATIGLVFVLHVPYGD